MSQTPKVRRVLSLPERADLYDPSHLADMKKNPEIVHINRFLLLYAILLNIKLELLSITGKNNKFRLHR